MPALSNQDIETPGDLIKAIEARFGKIRIDLAATIKNRKATLWLGTGSDIGEDSLSTPWPKEYLNGSPITTSWLNPPYKNIDEWAQKCAEQHVVPRSKILLLIPASVGSNWWARYVHMRAHVIFLRPRVTFIGHNTPYPKDLALCVYGTRYEYECWQWRKNDVRS